MALLRSETIDAVTVVSALANVLLATSACSPPPGTVTHEHRGDLDESDPPHEGIPADRYTFAADRGDEIVIEMTSVDVDAALVLLDSASVQLESNDDVSSRHRNALISLRAPKKDTYTVVATRGRAGGTGPYKVEIDVIPAAHH